MELKADGRYIDLLPTDARAGETHCDAAGGVPLIQKRDEVVVVVGMIID